MESDEELMVALAHGSERALTTLVERHSRRLYAFLLRLTRQREDAADLLQETWIRVARSANSFDVRSSFRGWLYRIGRNLAYDLGRRVSVRERAAFFDPSLETASTQERGVDLRAQLERLPERFREILYLRYYEGMTEPELAQVLDIPRGTVKSRIHHALHALRRSYGSET